MAMVRLVLAAEQATAFEDIRIDPLLDFPLFHQFEKRGLVNAPVAFVFLVSIKYVGSWRKQWLVNVVNADDLFKKIPEIIPLGESSKLGDVVEAHIDDAFGAALFEKSKKLGGGLLGEANGVDGGFSIHYS